ncbi:MAG: Endoglucanase [Ilumatobacteraceae bacterium]|nr:Endoglucanase [Ilumatobacteraceae bacterium]MCU1388848.1 Endoglucanase [Ilumatobacteraceae bacterium]
MHERPTTRAPRGHGFTIVEILIAITLVGVLAAVVAVGVGSLTDDAASATCSASSDAARTATNTFLVTTQRYPASFLELTQSGAGTPAMSAPPGATVAANTLSTPQWTLTMSNTSPPTFSCISGSTTTTSSASTVPAGNTVTATARSDYGQAYYGESIITLTNAAPITAMTVTIHIVQTTGVSYHGQYTSFDAGTVDLANDTSNGVVTFVYTLAAGQTVAPGSWTIDAQTDGTTVLHPTAGDTWSVDTTSGGVASTVSGGF